MFSEDSGIVGDTGAEEVSLCLNGGVRILLEEWCWRS
jgi:hypothetical protein